MYGWRAKAGVILPSLNVTMEPELYRMAPDGISLHFTRMILTEGTKEGLELMHKDVEPCTKLLMTAEVDLILFGCTSGSLIGGAGWDTKIIDQIEKISKIKAITTSTAVIEVLKALNAKKITIGTPYIDQVNQLEKKFLEDSGFTVTNIVGLGYTTGAQLHKENAESAYKFVKGLEREGADCVFLSCTDFHSLNAIKYLEQDIRLPVVTSNNASMWAILKHLGIGTYMESYGKIFTELQ
jgi:maleate isomerase